MNDEGIHSAADAGILHDPSTRFRFTMEFMVERIKEETYQTTRVPINIPASFQLVIPDDRSQRPFFEYQIEFNKRGRLGLRAKDLCAKQCDEFCPSARHLPMDGLIDVLKWLDEVNIWEWEPPSLIQEEKSARRNRTFYSEKQRSEVHPMWAPFVNLDDRVLLNDSFGFDASNADYIGSWSLVVSRLGRSFEASFPVYGAPVPSSLAFDDPYCASIVTEEVPILVNHLVFLNNDPIIVGLTKRLFRLLPARKPLPQVAKLIDETGSLFEIDFGSMVARKILKTEPYRGNGVKPLLTYEVPISEYDRMRFWAGLLGFKGFTPSCATHAKLTATHLWPGVVHSEPSGIYSGRDWSAELCDGVRSWKFERGLVSEHDFWIYQRFRQVFGMFFPDESQSLLPPFAPLFSRPKR
jgi:hypothetical protein